MERGVPLAVLGVVVFGVMLGAVVPGMVVSEDVPWPTSESTTNSTLTDLVITSHNPVCTALFLDHLGVTRLTDVWPYYNYSNGKFGYDSDEYKKGINITAVMLTSNTNRTVSAILERPDVSLVTTYPSVPPNTTNAERPVPLKTYTNPNAVVIMSSNVAPYTPCDVIRKYQADVIMDQLGWAGSPYPSIPALAGVTVQAAARVNGIQNYTLNYTEADLDPWPLVGDLRLADDGLEYYGDLMAVLIDTSNITATWPYLKKNGAVVYRVFDNSGNMTYGGLRAYIPPSLVWALLERGDVNRVIEKNYYDDFYDHYYGSVYTRGLDLVHPNVENWHKWGFDGKGVKVGIMHRGFNTGGSSGELPNMTVDRCFPHSNNYCQLYSIYHNNNRHGSGLVEIVMDMAPGADLYLYNMGEHEPQDFHEAVDWMISKNVSIVVSSIGLPFEGPGDGTTFFPKDKMQSVMYAVDRAVDEGILWVQSGGNSGYGGSWGGPITSQNVDSNYIVFAGVGGRKVTENKMLNW